MDKKIYDVVIIGGGAAGLTSGIYASRNGLKTVVLERLITGGQIINAEKIVNFPGFPDGIPGAVLGPKLQTQAMDAGAEIQLQEAKRLKPNGTGWIVETYDSDLETKAVIIAGGSTLKKLKVNGEDELHGAGVSYCATCDGVFFTGQSVAVIGGGDSALDEALTLTEYANRVIIFVKEKQFSGQHYLQQRVMSHSKIEVCWQTTIEEIHSVIDKEVNGISVTNCNSGETYRVELQGVFIYVGLEPNTGYLSDVLELDQAGHIPTDLSMATPVLGLFAAGDIRQFSAGQLASASGDGATAAISASKYIRTMKT